MKKMHVPMQIKEAGDTGLFSGYASIFGNVDLGGDVISKDEPFKEIQTNDEGKVVVLFSHDSGNGWGSTASGGMPIGKATVEQNSKGLKFDGQLVMEDPFCQRVLSHMKAKTLTGMSIGYDVLPGGYEILNSGIRQLNALKLWEISPVIWGMNPKASIDTVKVAAQLTNIREFEEFLREAGFSKAQAVAIASGGWPTLQSRRESGEAGDAKACIDFLTKFTEGISQ
jgi:HK97 family phage prohead protease